MKKYLILLLGAALSVALFTTSCEKEDVEDAVEEYTGASMKATVNDTAWTAITRVTKFFTTTNSFVITGTSTDGKIMIVTIRGEEVGTYTTSVELENPSAQVGAVWRANSTNYFSNKGTVEITKLDKTKKEISGTFSFDLISSSDPVGFSVTSGTFSNLEYSESDDAEESN